MGKKTPFWGLGSAVEGLQGPHSGEGQGVKRKTMQRQLQLREKQNRQWKLPKITPTYFETVLHCYIKTKAANPLLSFPSSYYIHMLLNTLHMYHLTNKLANI